eukprot:PITA_01484
MATSMGWNIHQMDVKSAFLNGAIDEEVYIEQPLGFEIKDGKAYVCILKKELYGLKQAPRACMLEWMHTYKDWASQKDLLTQTSTLRRNDVQLTGYTDSVWGGNEYDGRSITGGCFSLGSSMVSWMNKKQDTIALSSVEAEYVAACEVSQEVVWLRKMLSDLFKGPMNPTMICSDNTSCIRLSEDPVFHRKTKHINNKYHYIRELVQNGVVQLQYISTYKQVVDILMKSLPNKKLVYLRDKLGLVDLSSRIERER